jgi:hypothetical protein
MPFCPMCGSEYETGVEKCCDCNEVLVAHLPAEGEETEQEITSERLIQVAVFNESVEANLRKTRLESEGIDCFLEGDIAQNILIFAGAAFRGIKLKVRESDAEKAIEILNQEPLKTNAAEDADREDIYGPQCPQCGSLSIISQKHSPALIFISLLLLGIPFLFMRKRCDCHACGHVW